MLNLPSYEIKEELHYGMKTVAYRAVRLSDNKKVILKTLRPLNSLSLNDAAVIQHEYDMLEDIDIEGVVHAYDLLKSGDANILVLEDVKGKNLKDFLAGRPLAIEQFFKIALQLIKIVGSLHRKHIIHKAIKSANIIIDPVDLIVKLSDFSMASHIELESQPPVFLDVLEDSLNYMSPEQTGRMNQMIDYRTDFYSLGVTFFEMLLGRLPFETNDSLKLVYDHLTKIPPAISEINKKVPIEVSAIVNKLLSKNPNDRYVTAEGICYDMAKCAKEWSELGRITPFKLGEKDIAEQLKISHKLYGREPQIKRLMDAFSRVSKGSSEIIFVTGCSGIGKSSLVHGIDKAIAKHHGYYISGKCDKLQKNIPYYALTKAFNDLADLLFSEPESRLGEIKKELQDVLGTNAQLLLDWAPRFENILGKHLSVKNVSFSESQNRFNNLFKKLINIFATARHPLVLFIDDLQWADAASLNLIKIFLSSSKYFLVIGAYRDEEIDEFHPLFSYIDSLGGENLVVEELQLAPLKREEISMLLVDTLSASQDEIKPLSDFMTSKSGGNPFFINMILKYIYNSHILFFSYDENQWKYSLDEIDDLEIPDDVIDLLLKQMQDLPDSHQKLISLAACIGTVIDLEMLAVVSQKKSREVALILHDLAQRGLIVPVGGRYLQAEIVSDVHDLHERVFYRFGHDMLRQAAYSLVSAEAVGMIHLKMGRILLEKKDIYLNNLFLVLDFFNKVLGFVSDEDEKINLARLNLAAGMKAKLLNAYDSASQYILAGIKLMDFDRHWDDRYRLVFDLYKEYATCTYLSNKLEISDRYFNLLLENSKTKLDQASICYLKGLIFSHQFYYEQSCYWYRAGLKVYGIEIPLKPQGKDILKEIIKIKLRVRSKSAERLEKSLVKTLDPDQIMVADLLNKLQVSSLFLNVNLFGYSVCKALNFSLSHKVFNGMLQTSAFYAITLITIFNDMKGARIFGDLVLLLINREAEDDLDRCRAYGSLGIMLNHWFQPESLCINYLDKAIQIGDRIGANQPMGLALAFKYNELFFFGKNLQEIKKDLTKTNKELNSLKHSTALRVIEGPILFVNVLLGKKDYDDLGFAVRAKEMKDANYLAALYGYYICGMFINYELGDYKKAVELGDKGDQYFQYSKGVYLSTVGKMLYVLSLLKYYASLSDNQEKKLCKKRISNGFKIIKNWKNFCPINYSFIYYICCAEYERVFGKKKSAMEYYVKAIAEAGKLEIPYFSGIAHECAGEFYRETDPKLARDHIQETYSAYLRWGAKVKYEKMQESYPKWLRSSSS
jgi:predicted ATPase/tRNA A-37 threonylcarbamoyl transferase component Bud32